MLLYRDQFIGGLTSLAASWVTQSTQVRAQHALYDKIRRQELYKFFIEEASRLYGDALVNDEAPITRFVDLYAMLSQMRVMSSPAVVQTADAVVRLVIDTYFEPTKTLRDLREILKAGHMDPLREFSEACREDLHHFSPTSAAKYVRSLRYYVAASLQSREICSSLTRQRFSCNLWGAA